VVIDMQLAWGNKVSPEFRTRIGKLCDNLCWDKASHGSILMSCMAFESGQTFSPSIKNAAGSGATGLIQFMPATAKGMKTTVEDLAKMTAVEQLDYVEKYFFPYAPRIKTLSDMYMAILMPKYIGSPDNAVLFSDPKVGYRQNSGLDSNRDGFITKAEASAKVMGKYNKGMNPPLVYIGDF